MWRVGRKERMGGDKKEGRGENIKKERRKGGDEEGGTEGLLKTNSLDQSDKTKLRREIKPKGTEHSRKTLVCISIIATVRFKPLIFL